MTICAFSGRGWALPHCPKCGKEIRRQTIDQIVDQILSLPEGTRFQLLSPVVRSKKGEHQKVFEEARKAGFSRVRVYGELRDLSEEFDLDKKKKHNIEIVVDRLVLKPDLGRRLTDSIETACKRSGGLVPFRAHGRPHPSPSSRKNYACGRLRRVHAGALAPDVLLQQPLWRLPGLHRPWHAAGGRRGSHHPRQGKEPGSGRHPGYGWNTVKPDSIARMYFDAMALKYGFSLSTPWKDLPAEAREKILLGTGSEKLELKYDRGTAGHGVYYQAFEGLFAQCHPPLPGDPVGLRQDGIRGFMATRPCPVCHGQRLSEVSRAVTVGGMGLWDFCCLNVDEALDFLSRLGALGQRRRHRRAGFKGDQSPAGLF